MKVSIITTFFNAQDTIQETIDSILRQNYKDLEVIFVDGKSTDHSLRLVEESLEKFNSYKLISEKDSGIYDGMNKGISQASGDVICILNADDILEEKAIVEMVNLFNEDTDILAGTIRKFDRLKGTESVMKRSSMLPLSSTNPSIHHPGIFVRKSIYQRFGLFDLRYKISADFEFISRVISRGVKIKYSDFVFTNMRAGGVSDGLKFHFQKNLEHLIIGFRYRKSFSSFVRYVFYVFKKFFYGLLIYLKIKKTG